MADNRVPTESCYPYTSGGGDSGTCVPEAQLSCADKKYYMVDTASIVTLADEISIQTEILNNGPLEAGFSVYEDFFSYTTGVYKHVAGDLAGGHASRLLAGEWTRLRTRNTGWWPIAGAPAGAWRATL
eukprot:EC794662.1.p2 GENE.EC794662.1~~EC794662.1.p2  ORF type:complete len:128 (+),score=12.65 EC794662.1:228-611(+)